MDTNELSQTIGRLRRAQPRNPDTMAVCDALEAKLVKVEPRAPIEVVRKPPDSRPGFNKKTYQRDLMRSRRAALKAEKDAAEKTARQS